VTRAQTRPLSSNYSPIFDYASILTALFIATIAFHAHFIADIIHLFITIVTVN
jgi:hypothetical protein